MLKIPHKKLSNINISNCFICLFLLFSLSSNLYAQTNQLEQDQYRVDEFFRDIRMDHVDAVKKSLRDGLSPNVVDSKGNSALLVAITEKSLKTATLLMSVPSIDLNKPNIANETPVMLAALNGHEELVVDLVDKYDVELNKPGWTVLHYAVLNGRLSMTEYLLNHHAYIDALSPNGTTPLMLAARAGHIHIVKLLLDRGSDMTIKNAVGMTVIEFAESGNQSEIALGLRSRWVKLFGTPYTN